MVHAEKAPQARRGGPPVWLLYAVLAAVGVGASIVGWHRAGHGSSDFDNFHRSAGAILAGKAPADQFRYPPSFQLLLLPLAALPPRVAAAVWLALMVAALVALPAVLGRLSGAGLHEQIIPWLIALPFVVDNLVLGQSGTLLVLLVGAGLLLAAGRQPLIGGVLVGLAAMLKVFPAVFALIPLGLGRGRAAIAGAVLLAALAAGALVAILGWAATVQDTEAWIGFVRNQDSPFAMLWGGRGPPIRYNNQALAITLIRTLCDVRTGPTDEAVRLAALPVSAGLAAYVAVVSGMGALGCAAAWRARKLPAAQAAAGMFAATALWALTALPLVWTHYFIWWLPALVFLRRRRAFILAVGALAVGGLLAAEARSLGIHMWLSIALFAAVIRELSRPAEQVRPESNAPGPHSRADG